MSESDFERVCSLLLSHDAREFISCINENDKLLN